MLIRLALSRGDEDAAEAAFYFSHSEALLPFVALLGLYEDKVPLTADNFEAMRSRAYRTSLVGSFSTNVAFVLYECEDSPTQRLMTLHQEERVKLPKCDEEPCDLQQFLEVFEVMTFKLI